MLLKLIKAMESDKKKTIRTPTGNKSWICACCALMLLLEYVLTVFIIGPENSQTSLTLMKLTTDAGKGCVDNVSALVEANSFTSTPFEIKSVMQHNRWVQYGPPRTATTLQYTIICMGMFMRLRGTKEAEQMRCDFHPSPAKKLKKLQSSNSAQVLKTHNGKYMDEVWGPPNTTLVFMTSKSEQRDRYLIESARKMGYTIAFVQDVELLAKLSYHVIHEYQSILELSDADMMLLAEFMRYWDILRQCCGVQMSKSWRQQLLHENITANEHNPWFSACDTYNISSVESRFINTVLYKEVLRFPNMRSMVRLSHIDEEFNGTYCERYNEAVRRDHLQFNQWIHN